MSLQDQYKQTRLYEINGIEFYVREMTDELANAFTKLIEKSVEVSNPLSKRQSELLELDTDEAKEELQELNKQIKAVNTQYYADILSLFSEYKDKKRVITKEIIESDKFEKGKVQFLVNFLLMNR